jgi:SagB-type dehydrogenase family enzyme
VSARRSLRDYSGRAVSLPQLSTLLWHANGITGSLNVSAAGDNQATVSLSAAPSGGGLFPIRIAVLVSNVVDLPCGAYLYQPHSNTLALLSTGEPGLNALTTAGGFDSSRAALALVYVYRLYSNSMKYGDSGLVFALLEAGEMSQLAHLAATALGLASCDVGGFDKPATERLLECDGLNEHAVNFTVIGQPED